MEIKNTLLERGSRYGAFSDHAQITQQLKELMRPFYHKLEWDHIEALEMIMHKVGMILNGDPDYADSWHDIAGYAFLVEKRINGEIL